MIVVQDVLGKSLVSLGLRMVIEMGSVGLLDTHVEDHPVLNAAGAFSPRGENTRNFAPPLLDIRPGRRQVARHCANRGLDFLDRGLMPSIDLDRADSRPEVL